MDTFLVLFSSGFPVNKQYSNISIHLIHSDGLLNIEIFKCTVLAPHNKGKENSSSGIKICTLYLENVVELFCQRCVNISRGKFFGHNSFPIKKKCLICKIGQIGQPRQAVRNGQQN